MTLIYYFILSVMILIGTLLFWRRSSHYHNWSKKRKSGERILLEDALKFLYDCEYKKLTATPDKIAGNLSVTTETVYKLLDKLTDLKLIKMKNGFALLTSEGKSYALRVIRIHRLWEKYLAEETSIQEKDWHLKAELMEHQISAREADELAAKIGNPVYDPHGDPIPTRTLRLPEPKGIILNELSENLSAEIIHLEDEPHTVYSQLVAMGLYPGMKITLLEKSQDRIKFLTDSDECILSPLLAENITVKILEEDIEERYERLNNLSIGEEAVVMGISNACRGQQRRRLMDLGIVPGSDIVPVLESIGNDPTAYSIKGTTIALRKQQTKNIFIKRKAI